MSEDLILIQAVNPLNATCAEIQPHLKAFWTNPDSLAAVSIVLITAHLKSCEYCQQKFAEVMDTEKPPWKK